jgi:hypothetical protein
LVSGTEINFDFKGVLAGAQGGDCNCAQKADCSKCAYGVFGYPCIADPCDQCLCGGGLATPPGSACLPCTEQTQCSDGTTPSTCLNGQNGPCEPDLQVVRKAIFLGGTFNATNFFAEMAFYLQGPLCHYQINWASSVPVQQVNVFALQYQFGTAQGAADPTAQCFEGIRYKVVNNANVNYNIAPNSLQYDPRFAQGGVPGLVYGAGSLTSSLYFGASSTSTDFRDATMRCPAGVTAANLPASFKVVILGGNIPSSSLNNNLGPTDAPNAANVGTHWILLPDRGICVGDPAFATQNDASFTAYGATPTSCQTGCNVNPGPPVFANPGSLFRRDGSDAIKNAFPGPTTG